MFGYNLNSHLGITFQHRMIITGNNCNQYHIFAFYLLCSTFKIIPHHKISRDRHVGSEELKFDILVKK